MPLFPNSLLPGQTMTVGRFTVKFDLALALRVQWNPTIGFVLIRQYPALTPNAEPTLEDFDIAIRVSQAIDDRPYNVGNPQ